MLGSVSTPGSSAPAVPVEVVEIGDDVGSYAEFVRFAGAIDVVVSPGEGAAWSPPLGAACWLVSPHGHRVAAVPVVVAAGDPDRPDVHLAVGQRDAWLVHPGDGWLVQQARFDEGDGDGIEALLVQVNEPSRHRQGAQLTFAIDQVWAPLLRGAGEVRFPDVPGHPCGTVERCVATHEGAPQMVVAVHVSDDTWLNVGAVYRLQPTVDPQLHLVASGE